MRKSGLPPILFVIGQDRASSPNGKGWSTGRMKSEFALAFNEISERSGRPRAVVMEALTAAMASAYRRAVNASAAQQVEARIDSETGEVHVFAEKEIVERDRKSVVE